MWMLLFNLLKLYTHILFVCLCVCVCVCVLACVCVVCSQAVHQAVHPSDHAGAAACGERDRERWPDQRHSKDDLRVQPGGGRHCCGHDPKPGIYTTHILSIHVWWSLKGPSCYACFQVYTFILGVDLIMLTCFKLLKTLFISHCP